MIHAKKDFKATYSPKRNKARINLRVETSVVKPSLSGSTDIPANIKVAIRVRPPNEREINSKHRLVVKTLDKQMLIFDPKEDEKPFFYQGVQQTAHNYLKKANKEMQFMFDNIFSIDASNEDVFNESTKDLIKSLMDGYNCSVFVYGATGAGKTHTMLGYSECPGITYLTMRELFKSIENHKEDRDFEICVSYLEIYNENVHDLLSPSGPLNLRDGNYGVVVSGLHSQSIATAQELLDMLDKGNKNRTQHPTDANAESSRSHAVFQVYVKMSNKSSGQVKIVKLSMIDLAGSERASATGCRGERFKEGANINRSLLALGNCINQLADGSKFIPYRDSKLTRLLKDSLGGNCYTVMIANVAPTSLSYEDTYNTLKYATRANKIQLRMKKNIVTCNGHISQYIKRVEELTMRVHQLEEELAKAQSQSKSIEGGVSSPVANKQIKEWQAKLEANVKPYWELLKNYLHNQSRQRNLVNRAVKRLRAAATLSALCCDYSDVDLREACLKHTSRLKLAANTLIQQATGMNKDMLDVWNRLQASEKNYKLLVDSALKTAPGIVTFTNALECEKSSIILQAQENHLKAITVMQYEEMKHFHDFIRDSLKMLRKYYLYLKGYGKVTKSMTQEYNDLIRQAKNAKSITWEDEQGSVEYDDTHIKFMLDLSPSSIPNIPELPQIEIETINLDEAPTFSPNMVNLNTTFKTSPSHVKTDESYVLEDSEEDLNATRTIESASKPCLTFPENILPDIIVKPINCNDLNSTFVLAQKYKKGEPPFKRSAKLAGVQKRVLSERTNFLSENKTQQIKSSFTNCKPTTPFKKHNATIAKENKSGFGSSANRFQYKEGSKNKQVGLKSVRRDRGALANTGPYNRPPISQTPCR